eukprot:249939_1
MKPTESLSRQFVLSLFKEQANRLNYECQQFQAELRSFISTSSDDSCINEKLSKVLDNYSTSLNKICVQYLIKLESQLQPSSTQPSANPNPTRPYSCSLCDISYTTRSSLLRHNRKNHLHTQSSGDENDDSSSNDSDSDSDVSSLSLAQHEREFKCDICDRCFRRGQDLTRHKACCLKKLSNPYPWKCDICERVFEKASTLAYHKATHSDHRPFKCEYCTARFKLHPYLVQHIIKVHKENPWKCDECPQAFRLKKELKEHMEADHKQKEKDKQTKTERIHDNETTVGDLNRINAINNENSAVSDCMDVDKVIPDKHTSQNESCIDKTRTQTKSLFNRRL